MKKVVVGLSGGVDSAVTAALLKEQGYEVVGVYLDAWEKDGCGVDENRRDALLVAKKLKIPFKVIDVKREYKKRVIDYFFRTYEQGLTPNPDILCNSEIKFGIFYDWAVENGFEVVATGHYARIASSDQVSGFSLPAQAGVQRLVQRGKDKKKDQSYFLWKVEPKKLAKIRWPLGDRDKNWVREKARKLGLPVAEKPDSMGICFIGDVDVREMLRKRLGESERRVVMVPTSSGTSHFARSGRDDKSGLGSVPDLSRLSVVGRHRGLWFYTIGQRGGFEVDKKKLKELGLRPEKMRPLYVVGKDVANNLLLVGEREDCYSSWFVVHGSWLYVGKEEFEEMVRRREVLVRVRNLGKMYGVSGFSDQGSGFRVQVEEKIFGVAAGQSAVFYWRWNGKKGDEVIVGGGEIKVR